MKTEEADKQTSKRVVSVGTGEFTDQRMPEMASRFHFGTGLAVVTLLTVSVITQTAKAAGFALREYSLSAVGSGFAGATAMSDEAGFLSYNPAASSGVADWDSSITLNAIYPTSNASYATAETILATPTGGSLTPDGFITDAYEPGLQLRGRLTESLTAGLSVTAPWGLGSNYRSTWAGRYYALESKLITVNATPSLAYQITPELTLSAGVQFQYSTGLLTNAIDFGTIGALNGVGIAVPTQQDGYAKFDADDWGLGYMAGALWTPTPDLSLGLAYRSRVEHTLHGNVDFTLDSAGVGQILSGVTGAFTDSRASAQLTTPAIASTGLAYDLNDRLSVMGELSYTWWSSFEQIRIRFDNPLQPDVVQNYRWKDTWFAAAGLRYKPSEKWTLRTGLAFDQTPTTDATRDPRIPDADRYWISASAAYHLTDRTSLELGYSYLHFPDEPINLSAADPDNVLRGNLRGITSTSVDMISLKLTLR